MLHPKTVLEMISITQMQKPLNNQSVLVKKPGQLNENWAQVVLKHHDSKAKVQRLTIKSIQVGTTTRVKLAVEHDSPHVAKNWFIKLPSQNLRARIITTLPRLLRTEILFYQQLATEVPVQTPTCLAAVNKTGKGSILVLADVSEQSAVAGTAGDNLTIPQAYQAATQLAKLHARFWQDKNLSRQNPWLAGSVRKLEDLLGSALAVPLMRRGLAKAADVVPPELYKPALQYAKKRREIMCFLNNTPQTLTHHDCHPGNLFWQQDGTIGFLDWQLVRIGDGIGDLAYLLTTTLSSENRREHERSLLAHYAAVLSENNVDQPLAALFDRYRAHCCYAFEAMVITLAVGDMMKFDNNLELIRKTATAVHDLNCFTALTPH